MPGPISRRELLQSDISTCRVFAPRHFPLTLPSPPCSGERVVEDRVRGRCAIGLVIRLMSLCISSKFRSLGFTGPIAGKRHQFMKKAKLKVHIPNPHKGADISQPLLKEILREAGIRPEDWDKA